MALPAFRRGSSYEKASRAYTKHRKLMEHRGENPSLAVFVKNLDALGPELAGDAGDELDPDEGESGRP